ncbi:flagellar biosynthetic protein FliO [Paenibacillus aquistagni]|uniref:flagellar biosynthetic protein FliO n=1 Tax=Paenibacillus aquistagni TaxID=1852522 RepID=UPI000B5034D4|nr:flagellar biosynthetic protein FliO [Paenibacillus aquistagni]
MNSTDIKLQSPQVEGYIGNVFTILLSLAVIIVLIVLLIRFLSRKNRLWQGNKSMRTLGGMAVGQNKSLQVVEVGDVVYVLGIGDDVTLIDKISDPEQVANLNVLLRQEHQDPVLPIPAPLKSWLKNVTDRNKKQQEIALRDDHEEDHNTANFHELLHAKLERQSDRRARMDQLLNNDDTKEER